MLSFPIKPGQQIDPEKAGLRHGAKGTHTSRTLTLKDLSELLATVPSDGARADYDEAIIEDYPEDVRGHSCLFYGPGNKRWNIHVICPPKIDYFAIITAFLPSQKEWERDMSTRKTS